MNIGIDKFRNLATSGQGLDRVKVSGDDVIKGTKPWGFNLISKSIGMLTGARAEHNRQTYEAFKSALKDSYGEAGIASLTAHRPETESGKSLSTDLIQSVIAHAEIDAKRGKVMQGPAAAISSMQRYVELKEVPYLMGGEIMIKKAFSANQRGSLDDHKRGALDWTITRGQKAWGALFNDKGSTIRSRIDGEQRDIRTRFLGHSSSEHAGIALDSKHIGEAVGEGLRRNDTTADSLKDTKYVVYEPVPELRLKMKEIAAKLLENPGEKGDGAYSAKGAFTSLFKSRVNSQYEHHLLGNVKFDAGKAVIKEGGGGTLAAARAYLNGESEVRPDVFCSEFAALCLELAMEDLYGKSAAGQDPNAVSPMHLEDLVNSRPDLFNLAGRYEGKKAQEAPPNFDQQEIEFRAQTKALEAEQASKDKKAGDLALSIQDTTKLLGHLQTSITKSENLINRLNEHAKKPSQAADQKTQLEAATRAEHRKLHKQQEQMRKLEALLDDQVNALNRFQAKEKSEYDKLSSELGIPDIEEAPPNPMH